MTIRDKGNPDRLTGRFAPIIGGFMIIGLMRKKIYACIFRNVTDRFGLIRCVFVHRHHYSIRIISFCDLNGDPIAEPCLL